MPRKPRTIEQSESELKLMDDSYFNDLANKKLENSEATKSIEAVLKIFQRQQDELDTEIIEIMGASGLEEVLTADASLRISYSCSIEVIDEKLVPKKYQIRKLVDAINEQEMLQDLQNGYDLDERGVQFVENTSVYCHRRKGKRRLRDIEEQKERLEERYQDEEDKEYVEV